MANEEVYASLLTLSFCINYEPYTKKKRRVEYCTWEKHKIQFLCELVYYTKIGKKNFLPSCFVNDFSEYVYYFVLPPNKNTKKLYGTRKQQTASLKLTLSAL